MDISFTMASNLDSKHLTDACYIKGGYFVVKEYKDLSDYTVATAEQPGTIIEGSMCYCQEDKTHYMFDGTSWGVFNRYLKEFIPY